MRTFEFESLDAGYPHLLKAILEEGQEVSPRGMLTKEITPVTITLTNPRKRVISHPIRKLNYGFLVGESLWYLSGTDDVEQVAHYNKQWRNYSDDGLTLNGAYGKRIFQYEENGEIINQVEAVIEKFRQDKDSRHGTVLIFKPSDLLKQTKDVPCNNLLRFSIRNNKLQLINVVRSNDIIFGLPYDIHFFTLLQELVAARLGVELGNYVHIVDSLHLYEMHFGMAQDIAATPHTDIYEGFKPQDYGLKTDEEYNKTLQAILLLEKLSRLAPHKIEQIKGYIDEIDNEGWKNYARIIASYNFKKAKILDEVNPLIEELSNEFKQLVTWKI